MPEMPSANWGEKIPKIFYYTKWFIMEHQVFVMIGTAVVIAFSILALIVGLFEPKKEDDGFDYREI